MSALERLSEADRRILAAVAAEGRLGRSVLLGLGASGSQLVSLLDTGWLRQDGQIRPLKLKQGTVEAAYASGAGTRQPLLRAAQAEGVLESLAGELQGLLGRRSLAARARRLQAGSLILRDTDGKVDLSVEAELRESIVEPFDSQWFLRTWKDRSSRIATRVLAQALLHLNSVGGLYGWASTASALSSDQRLADVLSYHALHRLDCGELFAWPDTLDSATRLGLGAAKHLVEGKPELALSQLQRSLSFSGGRLSAPHPWAPLLALLLASSQEPSAREALKSWTTARGADACSKSAARALRVFLRHQTQPGGELKRINPHQVGDDLSAWEELILGLTVYCFVPIEVTRQGWARRLGRAGVRWLQAGYLWMGRQALVLAQELKQGPLVPAEVGDDAELFLPSDSSGLSPCPGDLCHLFPPRQEWELVLASLQRAARGEIEPETTRRVEWYVDPGTGSVARPGICSYQSGSGWSRAKRASFAEAVALLSELPPEDQRVLRVLPESDEEDADNIASVEPSDPCFPHAEVLEALIGHPRTVSGAHGGARVEVLAQPCLVESIDDAQGLRISFTPKGVSLGLNVLRDGEHRILITRVDERTAALISSLEKDLVVPHEHAPQALRVLGELSESVAIRSPHLGAERFVAATSRPCLRIAPMAGVWLVEMGVRPFSQQGRFYGAGEGPSMVTAQLEGRSLRTERDFEAEKTMAAELLGACPLLARAPAPDTSGLLAAPLLSYDGEEILALLAQISGSGCACDFEWPESPPLSYRGQVSSASLQGSLRSKKGWYLLSGSVDIDEVTSLSLAELARLPARMRGRFRQLPTGDFVEIERRVRQALAGLAGAEPEKGHSGVLQLGPTRLAALKKLLGEGDFKVDADSAEALARLKQSALVDPPVPETLEATLRDYQHQGYQWLCRLSTLGLGACLADDMGLGKTLQILAFLLSRAAGQVHLVVAPTSVCTNWVREMKRFAPSLTGIELSGPRRKKTLAQEIAAARKRSAGTVFVTSYALLHEDAAMLASENWDTVVLDEAQFIKNAKSLRARAAYELKASMRIAATGTPVENHLGDLWSIFRFLNPDLLGGWPSFRTHFVKPVQRDQDDLAREHLRELIRPYLLRRTKEQVLQELPPLTALRKEVRLADGDALRYAALRRSIHDKLRTRAGKQNNKLEILAELTRLRRFCCHPRLVFPDAPAECAKLDAFIDLATELHDGGHRALVFSQYVDFLELAKERVAEAGFDFESLDGSTPKAQRQERIDRFQEGEVPLFLISLKAGGFGLNLTAADYVIHLDPWWNPAAAAQATDRAHRIGQSRPVTVYEFVTQDTIEEDILRLHQSKQKLSDVLLEGGQDVGSISTEELLGWLSGSD